MVHCFLRQAGRTLTEREGSFMPGRTSLHFVEAAQTHFVIAEVAVRCSRKVQKQYDPKHFPVMLLKFTNPAVNEVWLSKRPCLDF